MERGESYLEAGLNMFDVRRSARDFEVPSCAPWVMGCQFEYAVDPTHLSPIVMGSLCMVYLVGDTSLISVQCQGNANAQMGRATDLWQQSTSPWPSSMCSPSLLSCLQQPLSDVQTGGKGE